MENIQSNNVNASNVKLNSPKQNGSCSKLMTMLKVDFQRLFISRTFYIMLAIAFVMPILILVMTTMMDGTVSVNPQTGKETIIEGFDNVWQIIGTVASSSSADAQQMSMGLTAMCNINLVFFAVAVFICMFVADDFRSGYSKNLFTVRAKKSDYVISKTVVSFVVGALMLVLFFIGSMIGGKISGLPFSLDGVNASNVVMCMLSKIFLMLAIAPIYLVASVFDKQRLWLSILLSLAGGALLFMMIPLITPLSATILNVILCLVGGALFSIGLGFASKTILSKIDLL